MNESREPDMVFDEGEVPAEGFTYQKGEEKIGEKTNAKEEELLALADKMARDYGFENVDALKFYLDEKLKAGFIHALADGGYELTPLGQKSNEVTEKDCEIIDMANRVIGRKIGIEAKDRDLKDRLGKARKKYHEKRLQ